MRVKSGKSARSRLEKSLDGWQLGLTVVLSAWAMAMLLVPRPASPLELPLPTLRPAELAELRAVEAKREATGRGELSPAVRTLGSAVRAMGRAEGSRSSAQATAARRELELAIAALRAEPPEGILALRALQTAMFIRAVREAEATGAVSRDLTELGGGLLDAFRDAGWAQDVAGRPKLAMNDDELGAAYRKRWNALVALKQGIGEPSLAEEKLLFAFAVEHTRARAAADPSAERALGARTTLKRIDEYARLDPEYPADFARGVAHFGGMSFANAQVAFNRHLAAHPDGPLTLRAQNFARAALLADEEGFAP